MFITYKITCNITGKFYIGSHKTDDINDSYMGSGRFIRESIKKYGVENHTKEILGIFDNREESIKLEHLLIKQYKSACAATYINTHKPPSEKRRRILNDLEIIKERHKTESYRQIAKDYDVSGTFIKDAVHDRLR